MHALTSKNSYNLSFYCIIKITSVLRNTHVVIKDQDKFIFYINNHLDYNYFNQLYDLNQIVKGK